MYVALFWCFCLFVCSSLPCFGVFTKQWLPVHCSVQDFMNACFDSTTPPELTFERKKRPAGAFNAHCCVTIHPSTASTVANAAPLPNQRRWKPACGGLLIMTRSPYGVRHHPAEKARCGCLCNGALPKGHCTTLARPADVFQLRQRLHFGLRQARRKDGGTKTDNCVSDEFMFSGLSFRGRKNYFV